MCSFVLFHRLKIGLKIVTELFFISKRWMLLKCKTARMENLFKNVTFPNSNSENR
jgi:hypothetical protein